MPHRKATSQERREADAARKRRKRASETTEQRQQQQKEEASARQQRQFLCLYCTSPYKRKLFVVSSTLDHSFALKSYYYWCKSLSLLSKKY
ncbi:hypothetical protein F8M41_000753 [Gigaspora margarita]|uniref:Uncharacterized protein n=1 Tax=Gigaspora margarita TaxID=4874 RepID=A0A8H4ESK7_GIGMA|nr:hypothetical protein F8M41_000753 [Gigaspora margarita]